VAWGVNVVGYLSAPSGLGEVARLLVRSLQSGSVPYVLVDQGIRARRSTDLLDTTVVCVNPADLPSWTHGAGRELFSRPRTVGFWWWEVERFPRRWRWAAHLFDEIWVGSDHVRTAVAEVVDRPVHTFPLPVVAPEPAVRSRQQLGLPDGFVFLFSFNYESIFLRKNPVGLITAFGKAFADRDDVWLVLKASNGDRYPRERAELDNAAQAVRNVSVLERSLPASDYHALYAACDAYASLHRAEGFGLTIAEAMALGKPAIATGYSGNLEFMRPDDSYLVPWSPSPIPDGLPYSAGSLWAEPDLDEAARIMRSVVEHKSEAQARALRARERLMVERSPERAAQFVEDRMAELAEAPSAPRKGLDIAAEHLLRGPNLYSTRPWLDWARRFTRPFFRPYFDHEVEVGQLMLEAVDEKIRELEGRIAELEARSRAEQDVQVEVRPRATQ
jgi:glycosyltransferase involved in cell wall biosynthesis